MTLERVGYAAHAAVLCVALNALILAAGSPAAAQTVPAYNSLPGVDAQLFLDFDGVDFGTTFWGIANPAPATATGMPGVRPAYNTQGSSSTFTTTELNNIFEIWSRVAEAYSPFNINVTTVDPGNYNRQESAHVVISGNNTWFGGGGGVAYVNGFNTTSSPAMTRRTGWVFEDNVFGGAPKQVADAAIHEAGHMFGLRHQGLFTNGNVTTEYDPGNSLRAPNLGVAYNAVRGLWAIGPDGSGSANFDTDEMDEIADLGLFDNDFGYLPDETGTSFATAPAINLSSTPLRGVIGNITSGLQSNDIDYYKLELAADSQVSIDIDVAQHGPNLDSRLQLYEAGNGTPIYVDDPVLTAARSSLQSSYDGILAAGTYYLGVTSHGGFTYSAGSGASDRFLQDTGQYFITGSVVSLVPEPASMLLALGAVSGLFFRRLR